jgi:hypothetical protein
MRGEVRKVGGVAHSLAWLTRLSNTLDVSRVHVRLVWRSCLRVAGLPSSDKKGLAPSGATRDLSCLDLRSALSPLLHSVIVICPCTHLLLGFWNVHMFETIT